MNEKELEKMRKVFLDKLNTPYGSGGFLAASNAHVQPSVSAELVWRYMVEQIKEAYHKGYMEGTMEAL